MRKLSAFILGLWLTWPISPAFAAAGITQITVLDGGGTSRTINVTSSTGAITGNLMWNNVICDPTTNTQCAAVSAGGAVSVSVPTWGGGTLGAMANYGTSPGAVLVPGVNSFITNVAANGAHNTANSTTVNMASDQSFSSPPYFLQPVAGDNHANIKNGAGTVFWVLVENNSATVNYLRFYNAATGFNGCNSATNLVTQMQIPANTAVGALNIALPFGIPFPTGISICVTSGYATTDTTNATASAMSITVGYN